MIKIRKFILSLLIVIISATASIIGLIGINKFMSTDIVEKRMKDLQVNRIIYR